MMTKDEFQMLSRAVVLWHRYYDVSPVVSRSEVLCRSAIALHNAGINTAEEIAARLIDVYPGADAIPRRTSPLAIGGVGEVSLRRH
ncbi:hypothetical protein WGT02_35515 (plasmid) [Rhizobium sp. T1470]|uniref:hypothetical protein n=1 Tax=Rhizobium TaxID=379 RepID=UPI000685BBB5|nr:hypothetical protein [Rhizobium favelukesii]MCA0806568.1 hypothetical protein [Rhizobium sp. T1473]